MVPKHLVENRKLGTRKRTIAILFETLHTCSLRAKVIKENETVLIRESTKVDEIVPAIIEALSGYAHKLYFDAHLSVQL